MSDIPQQDDLPTCVFCNQPPIMTEEGAPGSLFVIETVACKNPQCWIQPYASASRLRSAPSEIINRWAFRPGAPAFQAHEAHKNAIAGYEKSAMSALRDMLTARRATTEILRCVKALLQIKDECPRCAKAGRKYRDAIQQVIDQHATK